MTENRNKLNLLRDYKKTENSFLPHYVTIPLCQEFGKDSRPVVNIGDTVKEGDIIARGEGTNSSYIHSSVPGKVEACIPCITPYGQQNFALRIKTGGSFSYLGKKNNKKNIDSISTESIIKSFIEKGIVNTFNIAKAENLGLQIQKNKKASALVVRMFDEDIFRITDSLMSKFYFDEIVEGAQITAKAFGASGIVFAVTEKNDFAYKFEKVNIPNVCFLEMNSGKYPCGNVKEIVSTFAKNEKKACNFDVTKNDLFTDSSTMYEAYKAVALGIPAINKFVHFSGNCLYASCLLNVKIGTSIREIVSQIGGFIKQPKMIIINGKLNGTMITSMDVPVTQYVKSVEFVSARKITDRHVYSCINCGNCRFVCPAKILPDILYNNYVSFREETANLEKSALICTECGLCNTVCPARLPLSQTINILKENNLNKNGEAK